MQVGAALAVSGYRQIPGEVLAAPMYRVIGAVGRLRHERES